MSAPDLGDRDPAAAWRKLALRWRWLAGEGDDVEQDDWRAAEAATAAALLFDGEGTDIDDPALGAPERLERWTDITGRDHIG